MAQISTDLLDDGILVLDGIEYYQEDTNGPFLIPASRLKDLWLSQIPANVRLEIGNKVIGSRDIVPRNPYCSFGRTEDGSYFAKLEMAFFPDDAEEFSEEDLTGFLQQQIEIANTVLEKLEGEGLVGEPEYSIYDDIAYAHIEIFLEDQLILDAERVVDAVQERISSGTATSVLFVCYASEDKTFVDRFVGELDKRALYAWYDKREIFVGDSITERIGHGLQGARYLIAVLSPRSIGKPWVQRELNSSLMRQLAGSEVRILPVLLEDCELPTLLADVKYADFTQSFEQGLEELLASLRRR